MKRPLLFLFFLTAVGIFFLYPRDYEPDTIFPQGPTYTVTVHGQLETYEQKSSGLSLTLTDCRIEYRGQTYGCSKLLVTTKETPVLQAGNLLTVTGSLSSFQPARNPGNFDWYSYYHSRHISYRIYAEKVTVTDPRVNMLRQTLLSLRSYLTRSLQRVNQEDPDTGALLTALLLGNMTSLEEETRAKYEDGGILHILSVSGMHMSILGGAVMTLSNALCFPRWLRSLFSSLLVTLYWQLCGASMSAGRAVIMFLCMTAGPLMGRTYDSLSALSLAGILILWNSPLMLFQASFQLSFGAILGMQLVSPAFLPQNSSSRSPLRSITFHIGLQLTLLPITIYHFFRYPLYSLFLNLLIVPLSTPLFLLAAAALLLTTAPSLLPTAWLGLAPVTLLPTLAHWLLLPCRWILDLYEYLCDLTLSLPQASALLGRPSVWRIGIYYGLLALYCLGRNRFRDPAHSPDPSKKLPVFLRLFTPLFMIAVLLLPLPSRSLTVTFLDVGQGDCTLLESPTGTNILIDCGSSDVNGVDEYRLTPFLEAKRIQHLDYVFLSHTDDDHVNGIMAWVESGGTVGTVILPKLSDKLSSLNSYQKTVSFFQKNQVPILYFHNGMTWQEGELSLTCLAPVSSSAKEPIRYPNLNTSSQVLLAEFREVRILFTGDCEEEGEDILLEQLKKENITCHILKVGHHGSERGSGSDFLKQLNPDMAIISCGIRNRYGHPHPAMLKRAEKQEIPCYVTAGCGAVTVTIRKEQARIHTYLPPGPLYYR